MKLYFQVAAWTVLLGFIVFANRLPREWLDVLPLVIPILMLGAYILGIVWQRTTFSLLRLFVVTTMVAIVVGIYRAVGQSEGILAAYFALGIAIILDGPREKRFAGWIMIVTIAIGYGLLRWQR